MNCFHDSWGKAVALATLTPVPDNDLLKDPANRLLPVPGNHEYMHKGAPALFQWVVAKVPGSFGSRSVGYGENA